MIHTVTYRDAATATPVEVVVDTFSAADRDQADAMNAAYDLGFKAGHDAVIHALDHVLTEIEHERRAAQDAAEYTREPTTSEWIGPVLFSHN